MIKANVVIDYQGWKSRVKNPNIYIKNRLRKLSKIYPFKDKNKEFSLFLTDSKKMKKLNYKFRKKNKSTDVLSFPFQNSIKKDSYLGDIALSFQIINKRSNITNFNIEFDKIWIHGYLHLIGYDHKKLKDFKKMSKKESLLLKYLHKKN